MGLHLDVQVRSHDNWNGVRSVLLRPGLTYYIKPDQNATLGYLYTPTIPRDGATLTEHRIWEQYIISHKAFTGNLSHRFRLEQRFIEKAGNQHVFAQRLRYFFRHVQPLKRSENGFTKEYLLLCRMKYLPIFTIKKIPTIISSIRTGLILLRGIAFLKNLTRKQDI